MSTSPVIQDHIVRRKRLRRTRSGREFGAFNMSPKPSPQTPCPATASPVMPSETSNNNAVACTPSPHADEEWDPDEYEADFIGGVQTGLTSSQWESIVQAAYERAMAESGPEWWEDQLIHSENCPIEDEEVDPMPSKLLYLPSPLPERPSLSPLSLLSHLSPLPSRSPSAFSDVPPFSSPIIAFEPISSPAPPPLSPLSTCSILSMIPSPTTSHPSPSLTPEWGSPEPSPLPHVLPVSFTKKRQLVDDDDDCDISSSQKRQKVDVKLLRKSKKERKKAGSHLRREKAKEKKRVERGYCTTDAIRAKMGADVGVIRTSFSLHDDVAAQKGGYRVKAQKMSAENSECRAAMVRVAELVPCSETPQPLLAVDEYRQRNYRLVDWKGVKPVALLDQSNTVIAMLAGQPPDPSYQAACNDVFEWLAQTAKTAKFPKRHCIHRQGPYQTLDIGVTFAPGDSDAHNLRLSVNMERVAEQARHHPGLECLRGFTESSVDIYNHGLFTYLFGQMRRLREEERYREHLQYNTTRTFTIYPGQTLNFPKKVHTVPHRDVMNLAFGWCAIIALGPFQPQRSGHLVLHNLRLVIEFPPGACILIPSACLWHSNAPVVEGDQRASVTFYVPNGLMRFIDNNFMTEKVLEMRDPALFKQRQEEKSTRWEMGMGLFSKISDIVLEPHAAS